MYHKQPMCSVRLHGMQCNLTTRQCAVVGGRRCPEAVPSG